MEPASDNTRELGFFNFPKNIIIKILSGMINVENG
jgi:hypothetical protein